MLSTPLISCSMGEATVSETTSAVAPAKRAVTWTVGGAMSGNSETGSARNEMMPTSVRMIESTAAKIGRSIKKWEKRIVYSLKAAAPRLLDDGFDFAVLGSDFLSRPGPLQAVDHDTIRRREARPDDPQSFDDGAEFDLFGADRTVVRNRKHDLACLVGSNSAIRHQE